MTRLLPLACAALMLSAMAAAQSYPAKPILVISPVQAGSAGDTTLRLVTQKLAQNMGQQLQVENITGAAGIVGAQRLARAAPGWLHHRHRVQFDDGGAPVVREATV